MTTTHSYAADDVFDWLLNHTSDERFIDRIFVELCERLVRTGNEIARATLFFDTHNPSWLGARILWERGVATADIRTFDYDIEQQPEYLRSPMFEISNGVPQVRQKLDAEHSVAKRYPVYDELKREGFTDYVAWPLQHTMGKRHAITFATKSIEGFTEEQLRELRQLLPLIALVSEIRLKNVLARTLLETYVGPHASEQILAGATRRGSGVTLSAAIMICDLRDFTGISDVWPRDDVIDMLNAYFDAMIEPVSKFGGEILKFMGDGLLAVFRLDDATAATRLLQAVAEAQTNIEALNERNEGIGRPRLSFGVGIHLGDVMYGNIGSKSRLDFTAIGPAVNVASRLENLTKVVGRSILVSRAFAEAADCEAALENLGVYPLRGLGEPVEVFAFCSDCIRIERFPEPATAP